MITHLHTERSCPSLPTYFHMSNVAVPRMKVIIGTMSNGEVVASNIPCGTCYLPFSVHSVSVWSRFEVDVRLSTEVVWDELAIVNDFLFAHPLIVISLSS